jgi:hypothetical protein
MDLVDDLRVGLEGVAQLVDGGRKVADAAGAVADRVDVVLERVTNDETADTTVVTPPSRTCSGSLSRACGKV